MRFEVRNTYDAFKAGESYYAIGDGDSIVKITDELEGDLLMNEGDFEMDNFYKSLIDEFYNSSDYYIKYDRDSESLNFIADTCIISVVSRKSNSAFVLITGNDSIFSGLIEYLDENVGNIYYGVSKS